MNTTISLPTRRWVAVAILAYLAAIGLFYGVVLAAAGPDRWVEAVVMAALGVSAAIAVFTIAGRSRIGVPFGTLVAIVSVLVFAIIALANRGDPVSAFNVMHYALGGTAALALWSTDSSA